MLKKSSFMRVFFGIPIARDDFLRLKALVFEKNPALPESVGWVKTQNCHLTLRFIGDMEEIQLSKLIHAANSVISNHFAFEINVKKIDHFPRAGSSLVAAYVSNSSALKKLFQALDKAITDAKFPAEKRSYKPHITLIRNKTKPAFYIVPIEIDDLFFPAKEVILYQSLSKTGGSVYEPLKRYQLA